MRLPALGDDRDGRLARAVAFTFIGAMAILALYFGRDVLISAAVAVLFAFILSPVVTVVRRLLPNPLAVALVVVGALLVAGLLTVLITSQLAEVAGSLTSYQANLRQKIQDVRSGSIYASHMSLKGDNKLRVEGCAFGGLFCGGQTWTRIQ